MQFVLVLDDYHLIDAKSVDRVITYHRVRLAILIALVIIVSYLYLFCIYYDKMGLWAQRACKPRPYTIGMILWILAISYNDHLWCRSAVYKPVAPKKHVVYSIGTPVPERAHDFFAEPVRTSAAFHVTSQRCQ